jgi:hypothetical protein
MSPAAKVPLVRFFDPSVFTNWPAPKAGIFVKLVAPPKVTLDDIVTAWPEVPKLTAPFW